MKRHTIYIAGSLTVGSLALAAFFVTRFPPTAALWPVSLSAIILFSLPVIGVTLRWLGAARGCLVISLLGLYALIFETIAVATGLPYGPFTYRDVLGPKLFDLTPYAVLLAWSPLLLGAFGFVSTGSRFSRIARLTGLLVLIDLVLDPAAVGLGFWAWQPAGVYYGVPLINFGGWLISGGLAASALVIISEKFHWPRPPRLLGVSLLATVSFWMIVNLFLGHWIAVVIAVGVITALCLIWLRRAGAQDLPKISSGSDRVIHS